MKRLTTAILAIGIALVFMLYMVTYTVNYNEIAIVTTFDKAADPDPALLAQRKDTGSVIQEPGLKWKWPWPIQRVQTYPTQLQVLKDTPEQLLLSDNNTIIINMALTWRIKDPVAFFKELGTMDEAESRLLSQMRSLRKVVSSKKYPLDKLVNPDKSKIELDGLEEDLAITLREQLKDDYGIEVKEITVGKLLYTGSTAQSVNERMSEAQKGRAQGIRSDGEAIANTIIAEADSKRDQLNKFADNVAAKIVSVGKKEESYYIQKYADEGGSPELAKFLRTMEMLEASLANRTTFVLDARMFNPLAVFVYGPGEDGDLSRSNSKQAAEAPPYRPAPVLPEPSTTEAVSSETEATQ